MKYRHRVDVQKGGNTNHADFELKQLALTFIQGQCLFKDTVGMHCLHI